MTLLNVLFGIALLIKKLIPLAFVAALLFFFWGIAKFIFKSGDEKAIEEGKRIIKWGLIALFVIAAIGGIISFLQQDILGGSVPISIIQDQKP
ncbi:hypothetical protein EPN83_00305 [Patescibacteria group bacterium]|nr:MAG: hypothetical protein EPN83_00305 [Patescibacteria group bacterium]